MSIHVDFSMNIISLLQIVHQCIFMQIDLTHLCKITCVINYKTIYYMYLYNVVSGPTKFVL